MRRPDHGTRPGLESTVPLRRPESRGIRPAGPPAESTMLIRRPVAARAGWEPFRILFVCTGNICRSPMAEVLCGADLAHRLGSRADDFEIASAGTHALVGEPMHPHAASVLGAQRLQTAGFRARQLVAPQISAADLVLCASREHREAVLTESPAALKRTFTLREFHRATSGVRSFDLEGKDARTAMASLVTLAASRRGRSAPADRTADDLADPYGRPVAAFAECAKIIRSLLAPPIALIGAVVDPGRVFD